MTAPLGKEAGSAADTDSGIVFGPINLQDWQDVAELPMVNWRIKGLLPERGVALLAGDTMTGKSFVAIDLAMRLVHDRPFFERKVRPCSVLYLCGEGQQGLASRLRLWRNRHSPTKAEAGPRFCLVSEGIPELSPKPVPQVREMIRSFLDVK